MDSGNANDTERELSLEEFELLGVLGKGTYGEVFKARYKATGTLYALKLFKALPGQNRLHSNVLRELGNAHVGRSRFVLYPEDVFLNGDTVVAVYRLFGTDLYKVLYKRALQKKKQGRNRAFFTLRNLLVADNPPLLSVAQNVSVCKQVLAALADLHCKRVVHRDVKPGNVLLQLSPDGGVEVRLCDLGMSHNLALNDELLEPKVCTLWYRPPELFFANVRYTCVLDVWSTGCLFAETVLRCPFLSGKDETEQKLYFKCLATSVGWTESASNHAVAEKLDCGGADLSSEKKTKLTAKLVLLREKLGPAGFAVLAKMLALDAAERTSAAELLTDAFFVT